MSIYHELRLLGGFAKIAFRSCCFVQSGGLSDSVFFSLNWFQTIMLRKGSEFFRDS